MGMIRANGVELNCQTLGSGPLLVMCHGLVFGSIATWYFTAAARLAERFHVVLYDMRGHGKSELAPSGYDVGTLSADLQGVIEYHRQSGSVEGDTVYLAGHSYGGLVALRYALNFPAQVHKLALVDAPLPANRYVYPGMAGVHSRETLAQAFPAAMRDKFLQGGRAARRWQERMEYLFLESTLRDDVRMSGDVADALLKQLTMPTLCLYGRDSDCLAAGERLSKVLPHARLQMLDCGHFIPVEAPGAMTQALDEFL